jgi:hypothetical protein
MNSGPGQVLKSKALNEWRLFWLISGPMSLVMVIAMLQVTEWNGPAVSSMIQLSVRWAVPWLFAAFAASSLLVLFPSAFTRWMMRNRKFLGLNFAAAMAWQGFFILWLTTVHRDYYLKEVYVLRDAIEGTMGYLLLAAMTVTSFKFGRSLISARAWRWLHKFGIYFLWAYAYTTYWWSVFYYPEPVWLDHVFYWTAFAAFALRVAAWLKKKSMKWQREPAAFILSPTVKFAGLTVIVSGFVLAALTPLWRQLSEHLLTGYSWTAIPETYLPYWPFEPFIPLFVIALGGYILTQRKSSGERAITLTAIRRMHNPE